MASSLVDQFVMGGPGGQYWRHCYIVFEVAENMNPEAQGREDESHEYGY